MNKRTKDILIGTDHATIEDAIAADITSALPIFGAIGDFLRLLDSESRPQKALQALDMITSPLPLSDVITPTNTLLYLNKKGLLPFELEKMDEMIRPGKLPLLRK